jgi:DNA polymerase (family 10)
MDNKQVARILYDIARLLEIKEENPFKIRAYQNAARSIEGLNENVNDLAASKRLQEVPGIGKAIAEKIEEFVRTGKMEFYETLRASYPPGLFDLMKIPNLGPRKIRILYDQLGIASIKELEYACLENRLLNLKGFGKKTQEKLLEGIKIASASEGRHLLNKVLPVARELLAYLKECPSIDQVEIAGSVRRWNEIINDLDLVASSSKPAEVSRFFLKMPYVCSIIAQGDTKTSVRLETLGLNVDLRVVKPVEFASALHHFTGSKEHNVVMRGHAKKRGFKINEYGIFKEDTEKAITIKSERELFDFFHMDYIPPEMREDCGEVEAALQHRIPALVDRSQLQGIFHVHSTWSDGRDSLEDMISGARERGYRFVGISEHSKVAAYAHGLDERRLAQQSAEIDRLREKFTDIEILKGTEVDILPDGTLDFPDGVLSELDFVIASVHSNFKMEEKEMTARICRALSNPHVDILGHATGRLLLGRKPYPVNLEEVLKTAVAHKKCIEINASPHRLELEWPWVRRAKELGIKFSINPDAHRIRELDYVEFGIGVARKGWATPADILNTLPWTKLRKHFS